MAAFNQTVHDSRYQSHNAHVVAYWRAQVGEWNSWKFAHSAPENRENYNGIIGDFLNRYSLEIARAKISRPEDICRSCGDIALDDRLCLNCED